MSEQETTSEPKRKVSEEFAAVQAQLRKEDTLLWMMKEQLPSMLGMMFMFILTIAISLYIRPWYDIAELQAYGVDGARQVRYIALQLVMIFIFTAGILFLAKYKKEWIIKYGIMGVLAIALLYATVPLTHVMVLDLESDPFAYDSDAEVGMSYHSHHGMDTHIANSLIGAPGMWNDSVSVYSADGLSTNTSKWTVTHERLPYADTAHLNIVVSDDYYSFTNQAFVWYVDAETGELQDSYACHRYLDTDDPVPLGNLEGGCSLAFHANDAMYLIDQNGKMVRYNTFEESPGNLTYQAGWSLPPALKTHEGVLYSEVIDDDKVLIVTPTAAAVLELESNSGALDLNSNSNTMAKVLFTINATSNFTSADFGHSPWSTGNISESNGQEGLLLLGEENGDVTGFEWNQSDDVVFEPQTKIALLGYGQTIQSVRITDLDESGFSDMLITTGEKADWLHTQSLVNRISFDIENDLKASWFTFSDNSTQFNALYDNGTIALDSGAIENGMFALNGPQFSEGPLIAALLITTILMILLYVHSEWYVVNTVGVLVGSGVIVMLGVTFVPTLIIIFMIAAAIYDAWAVYRSKHMLDLADTMIGLRLPILLVAPQEKGYSFIDETVSMKEKNAAPAQQSVAPTQRPVANSQPKKQGKDAMFMGLGDVIFPGMLVLSSAQYIDGSEGFQIAMATLIGGLIGYLALMTYVARGRAQAGLPLLNGGAILGYLVGGIVSGVGWAIFDFGLTL
jgi:presenilin-like A22 family membrane protease